MSKAWEASYRGEVYQGSHNGVLEASCKSLGQLLALDGFEADVPFRVVLATISRQLLGHRPRTR